MCWSKLDIHALGDPFSRLFITIKHNASNFHLNFQESKNDVESGINSPPIIIASMTTERNRMLHYK